MLLVWFLSICVTVLGFPNPYPTGEEVRGGGNSGKKLLLTPYIESGKIDEARVLALVPPLLGNVKSYSGYLTVDKKCQSNLFIWFFPAKSADTKTPVAVWLQGGPGASSLYGLFSENGPYLLTPEGNLTSRKYSWTRAASYLFIDNPVGTGYSYTEDESCYSKNQEEVGRNLLLALKQFFLMFPEYKKNPFFVTGESYGGKYVPALGYAIHKDNDTEHKINLQGVAIGNGLVDPVNQMLYSEYLYQIGLIDHNGRDYFRNQEETCRELVNEKKWVEAFYCFNFLLNGDLSKVDTYFHNVTGFDYYYNFLFSQNQPQGNLTAFVTKDEVRRSIHVGDSTWHNEKVVEMHLMEDVMKSVRPWLEELLEHYRVLIYNGQLDIIVAYPLTEGYLQKLNWTAAAEYKKAQRHIWRVDKEIAGYSKTAGKLTDVLVRNAGHMVPMDQPKWAFDLISRFFNNKPFY